MEKFRRLECTGFRIKMRHTATPAEFARLVFDDLPVAAPPDDTVDFHIIAFRIGDEQWAAITATINNEPPLRIVEPFIVPAGDFSLVPYFREEC